FIAVYAGLAAAMQARLGACVWPLAVLAGVCHAVQAAAYEVQRQEYGFWGLGRASAAFSQPGMAGGGILARLYGAYLRLEYAASGASPAFHARLAAVLAAGGAARREHYRETFAPAVRRWALLSANYRTLAIFLFAWFGVPHYYFVFDIVGFSAILLLLLRGRRRRYARFFAAPDPA
ncbi:MAG: CDP-alcohol phosphatidyltransferase family protein, partial [Acetobacteraceae bacterium]